MAWTEQPRDEKGRWTISGGALKAWAGGQAPKRVNPPKPKSGPKETSPLARWAKGAPKKLQDASDPKTHLSAYRHLGKAAGAAAHGHAMVERGLSMHPRDVVKALGAFAQHPALKSLGDMATKLAKEGHGNLRDALVKYPAKRHIVEAAGALAAHVGAMKGRGHDVLDVVPDLSTAKDRDEAKGQLKAAKDFMRSMVSRDLQTGSPDVRFGSTRSGYMPAGNAIEISREPHGLEHELMHGVETHNPKALERAGAFLEARTKGEREQRMVDLMPKCAYGEHETSKPDKFSHPYIGSQYFWGEPAKRFATEVTSMGVQALLHAPHRFLKRDREHFMFTLGTLANA
jgi:hypothetical protein